MASENLYNYLLHLADNALILCQRNSEWCGHGPILEQDIAITNISLDLIGQSRSLYHYAAEIYNRAHEGKPGYIPVDEDTLAFQRDNRDYKNCLLVEHPNGDWGQTVLRQFFFSTYQHILYTQLQHSSDQQLAAIAEKALKEVTYHVRWSGEWVIRLGDGTEESHQRMVNAIETLWAFTGELFIPADYESVLTKDNIAPDVTAIKEPWSNNVKELFAEATLSDAINDKLTNQSWSQSGGKKGVHTEHMGFILAEMQFMQRAYPNSEW